MKRYLFGISGLAIMAVSFIFLSSCTKEDNNEEPVFPEPLSIAAVPGTDIEIAVSPNMDWTVSLPVSQSGYFWIKDSASDEKLFTLNGKPGPATITIGVAEEPDVETHTAELLMKMGGKSQVIAVISLEKLPEPNFPEKVEAEAEPGARYSIDIEPNQAWTVSVPSSDSGSEYFWFDQDGDRTFSVSGQAGAYSLTLCVVDGRDMNDHSVDVTMAMGGQSAVIRTYTLKAGEPVFELSIANCNDVAFEGGSDGLTYAYGEPLDDGSTIDLVWPAVSGSYMHNLMVNCNYPWQVRTDASWLFVTAAANMNKVGFKTEFQIFTSPESYPTEETFADLVFSDPSGKQADRTYKVRFPSLEGLAKFGGRIAKGSEVLFNAEGLYFLNNDFMEGAEATGTVTSLTEMKFYYLVEQYGYPSAYDASLPLGDMNWLHVGYDWSSATGNPLKSAGYVISVYDNPSPEERSATLVAIPSGVLPENFVPNRDLFNQMHTALKPEYGQYVFVTVRQEGTSGTVSSGIDISFSDGLAEFEGEGPGKLFMFEDLAELEDPYSDADLADFGDILEMGGSVYRITYWDAMLENPHDYGFYFDFSGSYSMMMVNPAGDGWLKPELLNGNELYISMGEPGQDEKGAVIFYDEGGNRICAVICVKRY